MRRDLIIGLLCSILIHGGLAWGGNLSFHFGKKKKTAKDDAPTIELMELPKMEPEPPEPQDLADAAETANLAPPSLIDVPSAVSFDSIVQAVQPPPPPKATISNVAPKS